MVVGIGASGRRLSRGPGAVVLLATGLLLGGLAALCLGGRWLAADLGLMTVAIGILGPVVGVTAWLRRRTWWPFMVAFAWYGAFGLLLVANLAPDEPWAADLGDGAWREPIVALGGPQAWVGVAWVIAAAAGAVFLLRARAAAGRSR